VDKWKYFEIIHREHLLCNPMSGKKFAQLVNLVRLPPGARVLEIAVGKGEFIVQLAERYGASGVGVDLSPYCVADARRKRLKRVPEADLTFLEMDGADYQPHEPESFDVAACIGAGWIYGGYRGTLEALMAMAAPQSWIVVGEPFWKREPVAAYLEASGQERTSYGTHEGNVATGQELGLWPAYALASNLDDWDQYEGLQWHAAERWASAHPDDPDVGDLLRRVRQSREIYLRWARDTLGWAIYLFRKGFRAPDPSTS
jgi:hypothetical protein